MIFVYLIALYLANVGLLALQDNVRPRDGDPKLGGPFAQAFSFFWIEIVIIGTAYLIFN